VRITQLLDLAAGQIDQPRPRLLCDHWLRPGRALSSRAASDMYRCDWNPLQLIVFKESVY
jgi:hypothetical protein